jgi:hypothetical protein
MGAETTAGPSDAAGPGPTRTEAFGLWLKLIVIPVVLASGVAGLLFHMGSAVLAANSREDFRWTLAS